MSKCRALKPFSFVISLFVAIMVAPAPSSAQDPDVNVVTWQNDTHRTGQNLSEATLVSPLTGFGQLCNIPVDGQVYAQPLVASDVTFNGSSTPYTSVVYVVTENDTVYAINGTPSAANPASCNTGQILKQQPLLTYNINGTNTNLYTVDCNFIGDPTAHCGTIKPYVGILGTPVISLSGVGTGTLYLVTENQPMQTAGRPPEATMSHRNWNQQRTLTRVLKREIISHS